MLWPEERVTVEQMIDSFVIAGARAHGLANEIGCLEAGKSADLVVLGTDILGGPPEDIARATVLPTVFDGREVYRADEFGA